MNRSARVVEGGWKESTLTGRVRGSRSVWQSIYHWKADIVCWLAHLFFILTHLATRMFCAKVKFDGITPPKYIL